MCILNCSNCLLMNCIPTSLLPTAGLPPKLEMKGYRELEYFWCIMTGSVLQVISARHFVSVLQVMRHKFVNR